jgi:hypothetical protein
MSRSYVLRPFVLISCCLAGALLCRAQSAEILFSDDFTGPAASLSTHSPKRGNFDWMVPLNPAQALQLDGNGRAVFDPESAADGKRKSAWVDVGDLTLPVGGRAPGFPCGRPDGVGNVCRELPCQRGQDRVAVGQRPVRLSRFGTDPAVCLICLRKDFVGSLSPVFGPKCAKTRPLRALAGNASRGIIRLKPDTEIPTSVQTLQRSFPCETCPLENSRRF